MLLLGLMRGLAMKLSLPFMLAIALIVVASPAHAQEVTEIYSDLQSCDVTVRGDVAGSLLQLSLASSKEGTIQTRTLPLDGPGTWVAKWETAAAPEGSYSACARLIRDGEVVSERCTDFYYGGRVAIRFDVRDVHADHRGMTLLVYSEDLAVVDVYYMLVEGDKALYVTRRDSVPIAGSFRSPSDLSLEWKQILENGREYVGRVKIVEKRDGQTRAFMNPFTARDDAEITDTYSDETGASATVMGMSRVPFEGSFMFNLHRDGILLASVEEKTPILLSGDDETVEVSWSRTLDPGVYRLTIQLLGNDGDLLDFEETIIEAKIPPRPPTMRTDDGAEDEGSGISRSLSIALLLLLAAAAFIGFRRMQG